MDTKNKFGYIINCLSLSLLIIIVTRAVSGISSIVPKESSLENAILIICIIIYYIHGITEIAVNNDTRSIRNNKNILLLFIVLCGISFYSDNIRTSLFNLFILLGLFIIVNTLIDRCSYSQFFSIISIAFLIIT